MSKKEKKIKVFLALGLSENSAWMSKALKQKGIEVQIFRVDWRKPTVAGYPWLHFTSRLEQIVKKIDEAYASGYKVVLIGTSAGGSFMVNAFNASSSKVALVINICGRLTTEEGPTIKSFAEYKKEEPVFNACVTECEKLVTRPSMALERKFLAIIPFWDELVPVKSMFFKGARKRRTPFFEHLVNIGLMFTLFKWVLLREIRSA